MTIKLTVTYDGTDLCGWQKKNDRGTGQGLIEEALQKITGEKHSVVGSGRTDAGLYNAAFITVRIVLVVLGASLLTFTTSPVEVADGIESLLTPLKIIKFPVHEFALVMSIALRFIPTLLDETDRIIKAQKARGADFESGRLFRRIKALIPVLIPLLISSFRRADELADAMDARCYAGSKNRTRYKKMKPSYRDLLGVLAVAGLIVGVVMLNGVLGVAV